MKIIYLPHYDGIEKLSVKDKDDAGIDLRAAIDETITLKAGAFTVIPTGIKLHIGSDNIHRLYTDIGVYGAIMPRSGLGFKHFVRLANTVGVIDANYQGEIMIKVRNEGYDTLTIERGDRICQMVFHIYRKDVQFEEVESFDEETQRGEGGFGSSGVA